MKTSKSKSLLSLMLVLVLVLSLAACGKQEPVSSTTPTPSESASDSATPAPAFDPMAKYDPPITLKMGAAIDKTAQYAEGETVDKNRWTELYATYGINMENLYAVDTTQVETKLRTAVASGEYPDILNLNATDFINYANTGVIADISDIYDKYITDKSKEYFNADGGVGLASAKVNGKLYGLPLVGSAYDSTMLLWIRSDWLKNVGMEAPKTVDELVKVAEAFTKNDPDKNGKNDTYGLALNGKNTWLCNGGVQTFLDSFDAHLGIWTGEFTWVKDAATDTVVWGGTYADKAKAGLTKLQEMYNAGYISKSFGIQDENTIVEDLASNKAGMAYAPMWGSMWFKDVALRNKEADFLCVPIPSVDGTTYGKAFVPNITASYWAVSSKCQNPEVLAKLFNITYDIYATTDLETYKKYIGDPNGKDEFKLAAMRPFAPNKNYDNYKMLSKAVVSKDTTGLNVEQTNNYNIIMKYLDAVAAGSYDNTNADQNAGWQFYKVFAAPDSGFAAIDQIAKAGDVYEMIAYKAPNTTLMADKYASLDKLVKETVIKIIYGNVPVSDYDVMLQNWKKLGGDDVTKEANDWYQLNK